MLAEALLLGLERRLKSQLTGEVRFDAFTRGRASSLATSAIRTQQFAAIYYHLLRPCSRAGPS
jgi:hypothetical protein